jgi:hypothetical protein
MKRILILAALAFFMTSGNVLAAEKLTDEQYNVLGTSLRLNLIVKNCPFVENQREVALWAIKANLTPEMMDSEPAKLFLLLLVSRTVDEMEKGGRAGCAGWWRMYGADGHDHANLLLKR